MATRFGVKRLLHFPSSREPRARLVIRGSRILLRFPRGSYVRLVNFINIRCSGDPFIIWRIRSRHRRNAGIVKRPEF